MIRIGAVNIDTSHPLGFGEVMEKDDRARYVGVYNDSFRPDSEVEGFIRRFGLEKRCNTLEELAAMCDIGFIHGCDWDDHLRCAMPFIEQGKPVFIDKPLVGNLADCRRVEQLVKDGAVILGATSARYAYEVQQFLALPEEERGEVVNVFGTARRGRIQLRRTHCRGHQRHFGTGRTERALHGPRRSRRPSTPRAISYSTKTEKALFSTPSQAPGSPLFSPL